MESAAGSVEARQSPFLPMFEHFRAELDEHHDRRDRIIKASRDVTASSKKIIFALQRIRQLNQPIPPHIKKAIVPYATTIETAFRALAPDLQSINIYRYARQVTGGIQEYMEAVLFQYYLETQKLLPYTAAASQLNALLVAKAASSEGEQASASEPEVKQDETMDEPESSLEPQPQTQAQTQTQTHIHTQTETQTQTPTLLTPYDYLLGLFDMTGEVMRFAITSMATSAFLPSTSESTTRPQPRTTLTDLQLLRMRLEVLNYDYKSDHRFAKDTEGKLRVTRQSVEKVEKALYGLVVRGSERPQGWMPDLNEGGGGEEVEAY